MSVDVIRYTTSKKYLPTRNVLEIKVSKIILIPSLTVQNDFLHQSKIFINFKWCVGGSGNHKI